MIKIISIKILLLVVLCFGAFLAITKCFAASYNKIDGTIYSVKTEGFWAVDVVKKADGLYYPKPLTCTFSTNYPYSGGVEVTMTTPAHNYYSKKIIVTNLSNVTINYDGSIPSKVDIFKQPLMEIVNRGCSKYLDGNKCINDLDSRPIVYASCQYTS